MRRSARAGTAAPAASAGLNELGRDARITITPATRKRFTDMSISWRRSVK
jgi:hypothetical protein